MPENTDAYVQRQRTSRVGRLTVRLVPKRSRKQGFAGLFEDVLRQELGLTEHYADVQAYVTTEPRDGASRGSLYGLRGAILRRLGPEDDGRLVEVSGEFRWNHSMFTQGMEKFDHEMASVHRVKLADASALNGPEVRSDG